MTNDELAVRIVKKILSDMTGRKGLRQEWESIDEDIQGEIVDAWINLVKKELVSAST